MKHILILASVLSLFMSASSFAGGGASDQLKDRVSMMVDVAERGEDNITIRKMIVLRAVKSLANSNIRDPKLTERINNVVYSLSGAFDRKELALLNSNLRRIK